MKVFDIEEGITFFLHTLCPLSFFLIFFSKQLSPWNYKFIKKHLLKFQINKILKDFI